ncbi:MAG: selenocysteine-specific translation elongation factor [Actinobacteria bacterium]|nr:selenocysteine-specific translation elongation factor [Actinomycetota bacterium]
MRTIVVGTAGHVDHGKTSLIMTLTGVDTDRMIEEKKRGISIDLGFAHLALEDGTVLDFVDVPGHERFVRNMICGVTGIDLALLVIAADDGVMPQTREHFDVLRLLGVEKGLVVLSKIDLVDAETREMAEAEISELVEGSFLERAEIVGFSARTGEGAESIVEHLRRLASELPERRPGTVFRLPVDKVYQASGRGSVVTGTVAGGTLGVGEEVAVYPAGVEARARSIQSHRDEREVVFAGQRAGVNLAGLKPDSLSRGVVIARPGSVSSSHMVNALLSLLSSAERSIKQRERIKVYAGTKELVCRMVLMDGESLEPGESAFIQLRCEEALVVFPGDRFIVRSLSPARTVGGGVILQVAAKKYRRFDSLLLSRLKALVDGDDASFVEDALRSFGYRTACPLDLVPLCGLTSERIEEVASDLVEACRAMLIEDRLVHVECFAELAAIIEKTLLEECERLSLRRRMRIIELRGKLAFDVESPLFAAALDRLANAGKVDFERDEVVARGRTVKLTARQSEVMAAARELYSGTLAPVRLVSLKDLCPRGASEVEGVLRFMGSEGEIVLFNDMSFMSRSAFEEVRNILLSHLLTEGAISLSQARDLLGIGRNPLQTILEQLDEDGFTRRVKDVRVLADQA